MTHNFLKLLEELNITDSAFCKLIKFDRVSTFYAMRKGDAYVTTEIIGLTKNRFPHFNINFLVDDKEPMFLTIDNVDTNDSFMSIINEMSVNGSSLSKKLGFNAQKIQAIKTKSHGVSPDVMVKFKQVYPDVDLNSLFIKKEYYTSNLTLERLLKEWTDYPRK